MGETNDKRAEDGESQRSPPDSSETSDVIRDHLTTPEWAPGSASYSDGP